MKICLDPGHGMSNKSPGVYDPGCVRGGLHEADIVLEWALTLEAALQARNIPVWLTRRNNTDHCSLLGRATRAQEAGCSHLLSIHVNDADAPTANGTETFTINDHDFAAKVQSCLISGLSLRNRGVKTERFTVLRFNGVAALAELGFIGAPQDVKAFTSAALRAHTCRMLADLF